MSSSVPAESLAASRERYRAERDKRVAASRRDLPELTGDLARYLDDPYTPVRPREPVADEVDVIVVGAGLGGLMIAAALRTNGIERVRLIDSAGDVGGVWYWNRYPGARCDVESLVYMPLLEEVGTRPTEKYARASAILEHAQRIAKHYGLDEYALLQTTVTGMEWDEPAAQWSVTTDRGDQLRSSFVILANGPLQKLKLPAVPGIESFTGRAFHTSRWDFAYTGGADDTDPTRLGDKVVGVVGTGATAVQCVPPLGRSAKHLYVFQRTPSTVGVRDNQDLDPQWLASLPPGWQRARQENFTSVLYGGEVEADLVDDSWTHVWREMVVNPQFRSLGPDELAARKEAADLAVMEAVRARIRSTVNDPATAAALMPYYRYMCKRPTFHDEYLDTFNRPNVTLIDTDGKGLEAVTERGVLVGDHEYEVDCLVFATGFEWGTAFTRRIGFDVIGRYRRSLAAKWSTGIATFHGLMTTGFPNMLVQPAPSSQNVETVNFVHTMQENARHMAYIVAAVRERGATTFDVAESAELGWVQTIIDRAPDDREFLESCTPGRKNNEGLVSGLAATDKNFGGGPLEFYRLLADWRADGRLPGLVLG